MKVKIEIDTQTFVRFWLVVIAFGLLGVALYWARPALILLVISFFLALALNAPVHQLVKLLPGKSRLGGTAVAYFSVVAILGAVIFLVVPPIVQQTSHFIDTIPGLIDKNRGQVNVLNNFIEKYNLQPQVDQAVQNAKDNATKWAQNIGTNVIAGIGSLVSFLVSLVLVLVMSFLMLLEGPSWMKRIWSVYDDEQILKQHKRVVSKMYEVMKGYVNGQIAVAAIAGVCAGLTVFILSFIFADVPSSLAMPTVAIAFVLSLVPMFGATIAGVLITLMLMLNSVSAGLVFAVYFIIYQQIENNFVSPAIQSKTIQLSALVVLASVTIGTYMFGLAGGIISIPIAGWIKVLIEEYIQDRRERKEDASDGAVSKFIKKVRSNESSTHKTKKA